MSRTVRIRIYLVVLVVLAALFLVRLRSANGANVPPDSATAGHRLAAAWCGQCHAIEATSSDVAKPAPAFVRIANQPSTTALSLKVFLQTNHPSMPNLIIAPDDANDLVNYILSLKRD
jgi:mono/diheme cytochrome c family protein